MADTVFGASDGKRLKDRGVLIEIVTLAVKLVLHIQE